MTERVLVLSLGNTLLSDDGVGVLVVRELRKIAGLGAADAPQRFVRGHCEIDTQEASCSGLVLVESMSGYDRAIIVDAVRPETGVPGRMHVMPLSSLATAPSASHAGVHQLTLLDALELAKRLGLALPREITLYAVEAEDLETLREGCTPAVASAIPRVARAILRDLEKESQRSKASDP